MIRTASAKWSVDLKGGAGSITTASGTLRDTAYSFHTRFEDGQGTNPEELLAAAHAGCFTMALSLQLQQVGLKAESLETVCHDHDDRVDGAVAITESKLVLTAKIPGAPEETFRAAAEAAKEGCPVSKLYNTRILLEARLVA